MWCGWVQGNSDGPLLQLVPLESVIPMALLVNMHLTHCHPVKFQAYYWYITILLKFHINLHGHGKLNTSSS